MVPPNLSDVLNEHVLQYLTPEDCVSLRLVNKAVKERMGETTHGIFLFQYVPRMRTRTFNELFHTAVLYDDVYLLQWISQTFQEHILTPEVCATAARFARMNSLLWMKENFCEWDSTICAEAARKGHLRVLEWLIAEKCPYDETTCEAAVDGGHLNVLKWLLQHTTPCPCDERCSKKAASRGYLSILQWMVDKRLPWDGETLYEAARCGHENVVRWARENGCPLDEKLTFAIFEAVYATDMNTLRILQRRGCCSELQQIEICKQAARYRNKEVLVWAHSHGFAWDVWTCAYTAEHGDLEFLRWLRERNCPWDEKTCMKAAQRGRLEVLKWVMSCETHPAWSALTFSWAKWNGHQELVDWLSTSTNCSHDMINQSL